MRFLFAVQDAAETAAVTGFLPDNFWPGVVGTWIYFLMAMVMLFIAYKFVDIATPGDLDKQLLGTTYDKDGKPIQHTPDGKPNVALAIVAGLLLAGICFIIGQAIK